MFLWTSVLLVGTLQNSLQSYLRPQPAQEVGTDDRLDCWLSDDPLDQNRCQQLGCLWDKTEDTAIPACYFPRAGYGYKLSSARSYYGAGFNLDLERFPARSRFGSDVENLKFKVKYYGDSVDGYNTIRVKMYDPNVERYEVPMFKDSEGDYADYATPPSRFQFSYGSDDVNGFQFQVTRTEKTKTTIFDSSIGGLTFSDQFLQLATYLPQGCSLYGLGENPHPSYKHDMNYKTWPLFSRDVSPVDGAQNVYGVHPFYMCVETDGRAHGLFFVNSNAMEFTMLPHPGVSIRTTGGVLDFFLFVGNSPADVSHLYQKVIGRTFMPPYWALGFQLCRWGYKNLDEIKDVVTRNKNAKVPHDVQYSDIDYMDRKKDFTWDHTNFKGMDKYINDSKNDGLRWILIIDPAISAVSQNYEPYISGKSLDLFIHWPKDIPATRRSNPPDVDTTKDVIYGNVWPDGPVVFPDFFKKDTAQWWNDSLAGLYKDLKFDGIWIDMNEPSNFQTNEAQKKGDPWHLQCPTNKYDDPAYLPLAARTWGKGIRLSEKTLCMASVQGDQGQYRHYDVHSLYGWSETAPTINAARYLTGERSIVFSRSTYPTSGVSGGHWLGDNFSRWVDLHRSVIGMLEFNLFGMPYIGADICGFNDNTTMEMCHRWMQLGAFYPLSRNHNTMGSIEQDPAALGGEVLEASKRALNTRYRLLPYLYTLFHAAHTRGDKVINGLLDLYPADLLTHDVDTQFLWGNGLLISPVLEEKQTEVRAYLPDDDWYDYYTSLMIVKSRGGGQTGTFLSIKNLTDTPLHVRGGSIIPTQEPELTTRESRKNPLSVLVYPTSKGQASGEFFWDDGVTLGAFESKNYLHFKISFDKNTVLFESTIKDSQFKDSIMLEDITVFNTTTSSTSAKINDQGTAKIIKGDATKSITIETNFVMSSSISAIKITW